VKGPAAAFILAACAVLAAVQPATAQPDAGLACSRLAGDPDGVGRVDPGVPLAEIVVAEARPACEAAVAADPGNLDYIHQLGRVLFAAADYPAALARFIAAADGGHFAAAVMAGTMLRDGNGVPQDLPRSVHYFRIAADGGHKAGLENLGYAYQHGLGVPADIAEAIRLYRLAIDQASIVAALRIGNIALNGEAPDLTLADARDLFRLVFTFTAVPFYDQIDAIYGLARALLGLNEELGVVFTITEDALAALNTPADLPRRALFLDVLGEAETRAGRMNTAVAVRAEAANLEPTHPYFADRLGDAFAGVHLWPQAIEAWNRALTLHAANPALTMAGWDPALIAPKIAAAPQR
jgi:hypothetical protein